MKPVKFFEMERGLVEVSGKDRGAFLQGLFSQDTARNFPVGSMSYGIFPTARGRILADAYLLHPDAGRFLLDLEPSALEPLLKHLDQYLILLDAAVKDRSSSYAMVSICGEAAPALAARAFRVSALAPNACCALADGGGWLAFPDRARFQELRAWFANEAAARWMKALEEEGAIRGSRQEYEALQVEAGIPRLGHEMGESAFPQETGLEESLNFSKGCFVGAEVLQRIHYQGHVNRALALFATGSRAVPERSLILQDGEAAGETGRSAISTEGNRHLSLGIVKISAVDSGKPFEIELQGKRVTVELLKAFRRVKA